MLIELTVNLPGQSAGNIGEVLERVGDITTVEMADGATISIMPNDFIYI